MNRLVWKLLRQHISFSQLTGFFIANLLGLLIILVGIQCYRDVSPVFNSDSSDSLFKKEYIILTKKISTLGSFMGKNNGFKASEVEEIRSQSFTRNLGVFTPSLFKVYASVGVSGTGINMNTEMFFEAVPDEFVDASVSKWEYDEESHTIPIILPRSYLNIYNFGFAQTRNMPKLSEGLLSLIKLNITLSGSGKTEAYNGIIVGFSNRINKILVPQSFIDTANNTFAPGWKSQPSRVIIEVKNPTDPAISTFFAENNYETEGNDLESGQITHFLRMLTTLILIVGGIICLLSLYILVLSIFLLLQKNTMKIKNLLMLGFTPKQVVAPYMLLTILLTACTFLLSVMGLLVIRGQYMPFLQEALPSLQQSGIWLSVGIATVLCLLISSLDIILIRRKIKKIGLSV